MTEYESPSSRVRAFLRVVDGIGAVAKPLVARRAMPADPRKLLLLRCDGIGDLVFSAPAIRAIRARFPAAELHLMVGPWSKAIASMIPGIDRVIPHAPWGYRKLRTVKEDLSLRPDLAIAREIRRERYDAVVDLRGDLLSILPMALWGIPVRIGRATRGGEFALTHVVPPAPADAHEVERTLAVAAEIGVTAGDSGPGLAVPGAATQMATSVFADRGLDLSKTVLLLPGAQWTWRMWPAARFGELAKRLLAAGTPVAAVGAKTDESILDEILAVAPGTVKLAGGLDLVQLAAALAQCRAFVASESGPAAIASGVGARGVVLFGPGVPSQFGPRAPSIALIHEPCGDRPCYQRGDCQRPGNWCLGRVAVDRVLTGLQDVTRTAS